MTINGIIRIVARRDHLTIGEATEAVEDCINLIEDAVARGCYEEAEDILREELGLEPDFLIDIIEGD
jgi:hypothetical protein